MKPRHLTWGRPGLLALLLALMSQPIYAQPTETPANTAQATTVTGASESRVAVPAPVWRSELQTQREREIRQQIGTELRNPTAASVARPTTAPAATSTNSEPLAATSNAGLSAAGPFRQTVLYQQARSQPSAAERPALLDQFAAMEARHAGDADFDYLYGVLLLDSGQAADALFPLQRASQRRPGDLGIRMDLGRAYFDSNDNASARLIFSQLAAQSPPPTAAQVIHSYLQAIKRRTGRHETNWQAELAISGGQDSNVNAATELRDFLGFALNETARSTASGFSELQLSSQLAQPLSARWRWLLGGQLSYRKNFDAAQLNTLLYGLSSGLSYRRGDWSLTTRLGADQLQVDGEDNLRQFGLTAGWNWLVSSFTRLQTSLRLAGLRYQDALQIRDVDQALLAVGLSRRGSWFLGSELTLNLLAGRDRAVQAQSPYGRDLGGLQTRLSLQLSPRVRMISSAQFLQAEYDGLFFGLPRQDEQWSAVLGFELADNRWQGWLLQANVNLVDNRSDIGLYDYDRVLGSLRLSRRFD